MATRPIDDDELAAIEADNTYEFRRSQVSVSDISTLLAEIKRQRAVIAEQQAEIAAMRPVVQRVSEHTAWPNLRADLYMCLFCQGAAGRIEDIQHDAECVAEQARAYVAQHPTESEAH